jgi:hypothetical protein
MRTPLHVSFLILTYTGIYWLPPERPHTTSVSWAAASRELVSALLSVLAATLQSMARPTIPEIKKLHR